MKMFLPLLIITSFSFIKKIPDTINKHSFVDTTHIVDGAINEWNDTSFIKDGTTNISYAIDNNGTQLYVALKITDQRMQLKLMRMGMEMYIDTKGKHRDGVGVGFPYKTENAAQPQFGGGGRNGDGNGGGKPDFKAMRQSFATNLFSVRLFGFDGVEDKVQGIGLENSVNVGFAWDDNDVMYIEYSIPLNFIGSTANLKGKKISIGWKIKGIETTSTSSQIVAAPSGGGGRVGGGGGRGGFTPSAGGSSSNFDNAMKEQSFWGKYDIKL